MKKIIAVMLAPTFEDWFLEYTEELINRSEKITQKTVHTWEKLYLTLWHQGQTPAAAADLTIMAEKLSA